MSPRPKRPVRARSLSSSPDGFGLQGKPNPSTSWAPEMFVEGEWVPNGMRFVTKEEALEYGRLLLQRWFTPTNHRAVASADLANSSIVDGRLFHIETVGY